MHFDFGSLPLAFVCNERQMTNETFYQLTNEVCVCVCVSSREKLFREVKIQLFHTMYTMIEIENEFAQK